jgi:hypothetical protein
MERKLARLLVVFTMPFFLLFALRLLYGAVASPDVGATFDAVTLANANDQGRQGMGFFENSRKNYISLSKENPNPAAGKQMVRGADQKFEKVARVASRSKKFPEHERALRGSIEKHHALIQAEESSGLAGQRFLHLSIGVPSDHFDSMLDEVRAIGRLTSIQVNKTDKTNEYKELNAHRISLEKTRDALVALKARSGSQAVGHIDELINLENKIFETEENIQKLGVRLGDFDNENEFVTIQVALSEEGPAAKGPSSLHRAKVAFEWTVKWYLGLVAIFFFALLAALISITIVEKLKWIPEAIRFGNARGGA